jgi:hypothetical protein
MILQTKHTDQGSNFVRLFKQLENSTDIQQDDPENNELAQKELVEQEVKQIYNDIAELNNLEKEDQENFEQEVYIETDEEEDEPIENNLIEVDSADESSFTIN